MEVLLTSWSNIETTVYLKYVINVKNLNGK